MFYLRAKGILLLPRILIIMKITQFECFALKDVPLRHCREEGSHKSFPAPIIRA